MTNTELELADILFDTLDFIDDQLANHYAFAGQENHEANRMRIGRLLRRVQELIRSDE